MTHLGGQEHSGNQRWLGNYRSEGVLPIDDDLARTLRDVQRWSLRHVAGIASIVPLSALVAWLLLATGVIQTRELDAYFVVPFTVAFVAFLLAMVLGNWPNNRRVWAKKSLKDGQVEKFVLSPGALSELDVRKALGIDALQDVPRTIEVYPGTLTLARVGVEVISRPAEVQVAELAPPVLGQSAESSANGFRQLSEDEKAELQRVAQVLWRLPRLVGSVVFFSALSVLGFVFHIYVGLSVLILGVGFVTLAWARSMKMINPLRRACLEAARNGRIEFVSRDEAVASLQAKGLPAGIDSIGAFESAEVLPGHEIPWTLDGEPAPWRAEISGRGKRNTL